MRSTGLLLGMAGLVALAAPARAQTDSFEEDPEPWGETSFVIVKSTARYRAAADFARAASRELGVKLDLRGLHPDPTLGLTFPREQCEDDGEFPCYWPRGRFDDGVYLSVEHSSAYVGFRQDRYIVVLANGSRFHRPLLAALKKARARYPDAYLKTTSVYLGCVH
jgi:hypothetical protein